MSLHLAGTLVATASLLLLAACSDDNGGGQTGTPPVDAGEPPVSTPSSNPNGVPPDVPKVANPVPNLDKFKNDPCAMVSKAQAAGLKFDAKIEPEADSGLGPACEWRNQHGDDFTILLHSKQPLGIAGIYQNNQQIAGFYKYFEPVDVGGFPGVLSDTTDKRPNGMCGLSVGVTNQQIITVSDYVQNSGDPCELVKQAAEAAVTTMSKG